MKLLIIPNVHNMVLHENMSVVCWYFPFVVFFVRLLLKNKFAVDVLKERTPHMHFCFSRKQRDGYMSMLHLSASSPVSPTQISFFPSLSHCTPLFNYLPFQSQHLQVSSMLLNFHQYHCSLSSLHLSSHHGNLTSDSKELCKTWHAVFPLIRY